MAKYIDRDQLVKKLEQRIINPETAFVNTVLIGLLNGAPSADVAEVKHGEWKAVSLDPADPYFICTSCRMGYNTIYHECEEMKYCPNCGAKMEGTHEK